MFLAFDGDKVGRKLENLLIENDELQIVQFANFVSESLKKLEDELKKYGCKIIFASGDSILAKTTLKFNPTKINRMFGDITFSLGIGETPLEAMLALKKAKSNGNAKYCYFSLKDNKL